jgi:chitin deacetylase
MLDWGACIASLTHLAYRPPYGDVDNRVRAIARHVFGLTTVIWNRDALDWELGTKYMTPARVHQNLTTWYSGPKSPGLIILEHELSTESVQAFVDAYPLIKSNGWDARSVAELLGGPAYLNAANDTAPVGSMNVAQNVGQVLSSQSAAAAATGGMEPGATQVVQVSAGVSGLRTAAAATPTSSSSSSSPSNNAGSSPSIRTAASLLLLLPALAVLLA